MRDVRDMKRRFEEPPCFDQIIEQLAAREFAVIENPLPAELMAGLDRHFQSLDSSEFKEAGIGRAGQFQVNERVRSDLIHWLSAGDDPAIRHYFRWMEALRLRVNREFYLGLFRYECHYAHFAQGSFYRRHLDIFKGKSNRRLTAILYLNHNWRPEDGGALKMYRGDEEQPFVEVLPEYGRMVLFFSERFPHEVCVANRSRRSVTGWFHITS